MNVENMTGHNGNAIPNQFIITSDSGILFKSYNSAIAFITNEGVVHLSRHWDFSKTTGKYRNQFLSETKKETERKIKNGTYKMDLSLNGSLI